MKAYRGRSGKTPFLTLVLEGVDHLTALISRFTPVEKPPVPTEQEAGWIPEPVWMFLSTDKSPVSARNGTRIAQPASKSLYRQHYHMYSVNSGVTNFAIPRSSIFSLQCEHKCGCKDITAPFQEHK